MNNKFSNTHFTVCGVKGTGAGIEKRVNLDYEL